MKYWPLLTFFTLHSFIIQAGDTTTICSANCAMHIKKGTNLKVSEHPLYKQSTDKEQAERLPCTKTIEDTISKESFTIDQYSGWDNKAGKLSENHIGLNKVFLSHSDKKGNIYVRIEPDNCSCKWTATIKKENLPFVKKSLEYMSFTEN